MTIIGKFTKNDNGYTGHVETLTISAAMQFLPIEKISAKSPDFRVMSHGAEIGAAWIKTSKTETSYLSVALDDPSFNAPIHCRLVNGENGQYQLVWSR